mgnify:CR=1 FL=1
MSEFADRDGELAAQGVRLVDIAERFGPPCFVSSRSAIEAASPALHRALPAPQPPPAPPLDPTPPLAHLYPPSPRRYRGLQNLTYPFHDQTLQVTHCARICFNSQKVNLSQVFAGQNVGVTQVGERIWLVTFMHYDLGYFDEETCRLEQIDNPFGSKVLPMSSD